MQSQAMRAIAILSLGFIAASTAPGDNPLPKVIGLLEDLKTKIEGDGKSEQASYDKFACWCEETLAGKAKAITDAKDEIEKLQSLIIKSKGEEAVAQVEVAQAKKDIAANLASQREAGEMRDKEHAEYRDERSESEQCIGALEAAINVLAHAGTGKKGFLETLQETQLLSVVDGVRGVLKQPEMTHSLKAADLLVVQKFVQHPEDFVGGRAGGMSAAQIANNPFGDYAPQSTQIQGILKGMYDTFARSLEEANAEEADKQKGYEELMATKGSELKTLEDGLRAQTLSEREKKKTLADSKMTIDDTKEQLEADTVFFEQSKTSCQKKSAEWAQRARLRTEELAGVDKALEILKDPEAEKIFKNATSTFLQVSSKKMIAPHDRATSAYAKLRKLATQYASLNLAKVATKVKSGSGGHFDEAFAAIDKMIALLRKEEQEDINDRDFCQGKTGKNKNDEEDLDHQITKSDATIKRLEDSEKAIQDKIKELEDEIKKTNTSMDELKTMRADEFKEFGQSVAADEAGIKLLEEAIAALAKFYDGKNVGLIQTAPKDETAPETNWQGGSYGGESKASSGILSILGLIKEDLQKEILTARREDAEAQDRYVKDMNALYKTMRAYQKSLTQTERELSELMTEIADVKEYKKQKEDDLDAEKKVGTALKKKCEWVDTHFESRRTKRKKEIDGLLEAKDYLAGMD